MVNRGHETLINRAHETLINRAHETLVGRGRGRGREGTCPSPMVNRGHETLELVSLPFWDKTKSRSRSRSRVSVFLSHLTLVTYSPQRKGSQWPIAPSAPTQP